jgi:hypothetical protein
VPTLLSTCDNSYKGKQPSSAERVGGPDSTLPHETHQCGSAGGKLCLIITRAPISTHSQTDHGTVEALSYIQLLPSAARYQTVEGPALPGTVPLFCSCCPCSNSTPAKASSAAVLECSSFNQKRSLRDLGALLQLNEHIPARPIHPSLAPWFSRSLVSALVASRLPALERLSKSPSP